MQHIACSCLGGRGCMDRATIDSLLQDEAIEQAIEALMAKLPPPRVQSASAKRSRTPRARSALNGFGTPSSTPQRPKTAPTSSEFGLNSSHVRNVQLMSRRPVSQRSERDESVVGQAMIRAERVSISRHYVDKFPWQSKMCLKAMANLRKHRQYKQRDKCTLRFNKLHDAMETKLQQFISTQLSVLNEWREAELAEWSSVLGIVKQQLRDFSNSQEELRIANEQTRMNAANLRYNATLARIDAWECEDCKVVVHQSSRLEAGDSADVRALNQAISHARWSLEQQQRQGELQRRRYQEANFQWLCCIADDALLVCAAQGCYQEIEADLNAYYEQRASRCQSTIDEQLRYLSDIAGVIDTLGVQVHQEYLEALRTEKFVSQSFEQTMQQLFETRIQLAVYDTDRSELTWEACENANFARRELRQLSSSLWGVVDVLTNRRAAWQRRLNQFKHEHIDGISRYLQDLQGLLGKKKYEVHRQIQTIVQGMCQRRKDALHLALVRYQTRNAEADKDIAHFNGVLNRIPAAFISVWQQITLGIELLEQPIQDERGQREQELIEQFESKQLDLSSRAAVRQIESMQSIAAHKANVARTIQTFADQKVAKWLTQRTQPMMELLEVYELVLREVQQRMGRGFPSAPTFECVTEAEDQYDKTYPSAQKETVDHLERWCTDLLSSQSRKFADTLRDVFKAEAENLAREATGLTQQVLAAGNDWLEQHDRVVQADMEELNQAIQTVEQDLQRYSQNVELQLLETMNQATTKLRRFWQENHVEMAAGVPLTLQDENREQFQRLHRLLLDQLELRDELDAQGFVRQTLNSMQSKPNVAAGDAAEQFKLGWFLFVLARVKLVGDTPTLDVQHSLARVHADSDLIAASSNEFVVPPSHAAMEFAVAESKAIFHHCCEDRGISASLDWNEIEPLHSLAELHALASSVSEGTGSQIATNLRLEVVDEKMWFLFSSLLLTPETDNLTSTTMLARLLLTWRLCANTMLKVATLGQEGEGLQAALSESMIQQQIASEATIPRTAASWIVDTLTSIPNAPLSRFQAVLSLSLALDRDPLMPVNIGALEFKALSAGLLGWWAVLSTADHGPAHAHPTDLWDEYTPLRRCLDSISATVAPVSFVSTALSNCPNEQSWQGSLRAFTLWQLVKQCEDKLACDNRRQLAALQCVPDWSSTQTAASFDFASYTQTFRETVQRSTYRVHAADTLVSPGRTLWYATPIVNLKQLKFLLARENAVADESLAAENFGAMTTWLMWYEQVRAGAIATRLDPTDISARRQHRLKYVLETIERNSASRWNNFMARVHYKRAASEIAQNSARIRLYEESAGNFIAVVCLNREAIVRQIVDASTAVEHYESKAKETISSLESNAVRLSEYYWSRCRVSLNKCVQITRSAYEKLDQIWRWQLSRADKLTGDFGARVRDAAQKLEDATNSADPSVIINEAIPELRAIVRLRRDEQRHATRVAAENEVEQLFALMRGTIDRSLELTATQAIDHSTTTMAAASVTLQTLSEQLDIDRTQAEAAARLAMHQQPSLEEKEKGADERSDVVRNGDITGPIQKAADASITQFTEFLEALQAQVRQHEQDIIAAQSKSAETAQQYLLKIASLQRDAEELVASESHAAPMLTHCNDAGQLRVFGQVSDRLKSEHRKRLPALHSAEQSAITDFHHRFENLHYQLTVKHENVIVWLGEACDQLIAGLEPDILSGSLSVAYQQQHVGFGYPDDALLAGIHSLEAHFHPFKRLVKGWLQELQVCVRQQFDQQLKLVKHWKHHIGTGRVENSSAVLEVLAKQVVDQVVLLADADEELLRHCQVAASESDERDQPWLENMRAVINTHVAACQDAVARFERTTHQSTTSALVDLQSRRESIVEEVQQLLVDCENWRVDALSRVIDVQTSVDEQPSSY